LFSSVVSWITTLLPRKWTLNARTEGALVQAGHDTETAPLLYAAIRVSLLMLLPLLAFLLAPKRSVQEVLLYVGAATLTAVLLPIWWLARAVRLRQTRIRRSLPDTLDLIVVCIEAGISLDAAVLRVATDLAMVHPELAGELLVVNRKMNAGMPRAEALQGLWTRTGVQEVRALVSHIVQGEKWGTSSGRVLRVYAATLRRQRRQTAEKKAATAPVKMLVPLVTLIFPALLLTVMGPIILNVMTLLK
jgi:tight adherence protein C